MILLHIFIRPDDENHKRLIACADSLAKDTKRLPECIHFEVYEGAYAPHTVLLMCEWPTSDVLSKWMASNLFKTFSRELQQLSRASPDIRIYEASSIRRL